MTRINIFLLAICSLLIAGVIGYKDYSGSNKVYFVIEMEASAPGMSQIFFDTGHGYSEAESIAWNVQRGVMRKYSFPLPALTPVKSIRFDPINLTSVISVRKAGIENAKGDMFKNFTAQSFRSVHQISRMDINEDVLVIHTTENSNDPIMEIEDSSVDRKISGRDFLSKRGWIYAGYALLTFIIFMSLTKLRFQKITAILEWLFNYAVENPRKAITFIGLISAIASCYPIVFFGMSFISPLGAAALYDGAPWIPGFPFNVVSENFRGSDVGAMAWSMAPNSVVQHDSLFRYFEFPFWSRYVGGGVPLFAQGQSMIGDVLHWIPVLLNGSSIGWDLKFVLSKAIFAVGMGLLVFRLTDKLLAGSLIAISSCFLGFFAIRFNHPALFVLTYAPWVVLQWDHLGRVLSLPNPRVRSCISQSLLLAAVTWLQFNAGAPKEGVISACFMQAFGALAFVVHISPKWGRIRSIGFACGFGLALVMILAPYWLLFLNALGKSFTNYDNPMVNTLPPWIIVGFFDNLFFQQYFGVLAAPSVNLFVLLCVSSAIVGLRLRQSVMVYGAWGLFALAMATAYGLVSKSILMTIPFINNIQHVGNTFSVPMMILALIIAGYGIRDYLVAPERLKKTILICFLPSFLGLWLLFALKVANWRDTSIFVIVIFCVVLIGFIQLYQNAKSRAWEKGVLIILTCCLLVLHIRHGMHLRTGIELVDNFVVNPTERADFSNKSEAIEYVKNRIDKEMMPTRVIGEGYVLFPGFNSRLGLEGIVSVEAVRSRDYEKLLKLIDYPDTGWGWLRILKSDQIAIRSASLDMLGVGYMVTMPGTKMPEDMSLVHSSDLDVWRRDSVWPRAFFVNDISEAKKPSDILFSLADKSRQPFASVDSELIPQQLRKNSSPYQVVPASDYRLTNNSTRFSIEASGPGIIVLGETYYPGDFIASVNGMKVDYIRVNESSKGVWVNAAGKYDVSFTYRPEKLNQALLLFLFGLATLLVLSLLAARPLGKFTRV